MPSQLVRKLAANEFVITAEIAPPRGGDTSGMLKAAAFLAPFVDAINVTDNQGANMRMTPLVASGLLVREGIEPIMQLTCRDRNRLALQSDILSAANFGIENILALTGDHPKLGDHPHAKAVFDIDSVQLIQVIRRLEQGLDMAGKKLEGVLPKFCVGAVVNPGSDPLEPQIMKMEKKIDAGAEFFQTQAVYDLKSFENFLSKTKHLKTTVIAGIVLLKSAGMAKYMNENVAGISVPDNLINEMRDTKDKQAQSIEIAARLIKELKPMCQGIHIMPIGWDKLVPKVLDAAGL